MLRKDGFGLAQQRYGAFESVSKAECFVCSIEFCTEEYKPILQEVEKILAEAGLDEEEMRKSAELFHRIKVEL